MPGKCSPGRAGGAGSAICKPFGCGILFPRDCAFLAPFQSFRQGPAAAPGRLVRQPPGALADPPAWQRGGRGHPARESVLTARWRAQGGALRVPGRRSPRAPPRTPPSPLAARPLPRSNSALRAARPTLTRGDLAGTLSRPLTAGGGGSASPSRLPSLPSSASCAGEALGSSGRTRGCEWAPSRAGTSGEGARGELAGGWGTEGRLQLPPAQHPRLRKVPGPRVAPWASPLRASVGHPAGRGGAERLGRSPSFLQEKH